MAYHNGSKLGAKVSDLNMSELLSPLRQTLVREVFGAYVE